ncbi:MAG: hypothetical protein HY554_06370 [Elusimicrobia bacterium]|nr:hypothetical protein [Elusimicrobiota bacterium]
MDEVAEPLGEAFRAAGGACRLDVVDDGDGALAFLRLRLLPVVILSNSGVQDDIDECYALGANCYIPKTTGFAALVELARVLEAHWLVFGRAPDGGPS